MPRLRDHFLVSAPPCPLSAHRRPASIETTHHPSEPSESACGSPLPHDQQVSVRTMLSRLLARFNRPGSSSHSRLRGARSEVAPITARRPGNVVLRRRRLRTEVFAIRPSRRLIRFRPTPWWIAGAFGTVIAIGALLLSLPIASESPRLDQRDRLPLHGDVRGLRHRARAIRHRRALEWIWRGRDPRLVSNSEAWGSPSTPACSCS